MENLEEKLTKVFENIFNKKFKELEEIQKNKEKYFTEQLKNHEGIITRLISDNTILINKRLDLLFSDINELKASIEMTDSTVLTHTNEINNLKTKCKTIQTNEAAVKDLNKNVNDLKNKIIELENRSRRNNLRLDGIPENVNETWNDCELKIKRLLKETLDINEDIEIERAHRTGKQHAEKPRTIVFKLLRYKDKDLILKNGNRLKGSGIFVYEDFAKETVEKRKQLWEEVKKHRRAGKYAVLQYDKVVVKDRRPKT